MVCHPIAGVINTLFTVYRQAWGGGHGMRYRIYELGSSGEIVRGADLSALHDEQSIAEAADHINRCGLEIWQGNRKVAVISPFKLG